MAGMDTDQKIVHVHHTMRDLIKMQALHIPKYLDNARLYLANQTQLTFTYHQQAQNLLRVTTLIVQVSSPATLQIAERTWSFNSFTIEYLGCDGLLVRPEDNITLIQATVGNIGLEFLGQEMPDRGQRW